MPSRQCGQNEAPAPNPNSVARAVVGSDLSVGRFRYASRNDPRRAMHGSVEIRGRACGNDLAEAQKKEIQKRK